MKPKNRIAGGHRPKVMKTAVRTALAGDKQRIYDPATEQIWELTSAQTVVWNKADGKRTVAQLAGVLRDSGHKTATAETVLQTLAAFKQASLPVEVPSAVAVYAAPSRRKANTLKRLGAGLGAAISLGFFYVARVPDASAASRDRSPDQQICRKGKTISVDAIVARHLAQGDFAGPCVTSPPPSSSPFSSTPPPSSSPFSSTPPPSTSPF